MTTPIQLIVGLANPGAEYAKTRHNVGGWLVERLAQSSEIQLRPESKFKGNYGQIDINNQKCHLLIPSTFMNLSGQSVLAVASFYKILPEAILIAHDDIDIQTGITRLKFDGGAGGHNGLRNIIEKLHTKSFHRLRIGIGHPGNSKQVHDYVLTQPSKHDLQLIEQGIDDALAIIEEVVTGKFQEAMKILHTK